MNNIIIGTAGHVDHGKTSLIKALCGIDTDRLKEEQKRGLTIELGFADLHTPDGDVLGIIDVPGHEKFVRNMLAGIGGIDLVLLVIAADESVMPQTLEHLEILKLLEISQGIVVLTKADLVDEEWMELVKDDISSLVEGGFLEGAEIIEVSSHTGLNMDRLKEKIFAMAAQVTPKKTNASLLRLPIDRVFTIGGFGTVITGTLMEGKVSVGQDIELYPSEKIAKVRSVQVHGQQREEAYAGQRTAVNLVNIKKEEIEKGNVISVVDGMTNTMMVDVKIQMLETTDRELLHGSRLHLYYGSDEVICKAVLLDTDVLGKGESAYAQLRLETHIALRKGDHFVLRFYSPVETIAGGRVLNPHPNKHKRHDADTLRSLAVLDLGTEEDCIEEFFLLAKTKFIDTSRLAQDMRLTEDEMQQRLQTLLSEHRLALLADKYPVHKSFPEHAKSVAPNILNEYYKEQPLSKGMQKEEFRNKLMHHLYVSDEKIMDSLLDDLVNERVIQQQGKTVSLVGYEPVLNEAQKAMRARILDAYEKKGYEPPEESEMIQQEKQKADAKQVINALVDAGELVRITTTTCMHHSAYEKAITMVKDHIRKEGSITLAQTRDLIQSSRKYALLLLEHLDEKKITMKRGDERILKGE